MQLQVLCFLLTFYLQTSQNSELKEIIKPVPFPYRVIISHFQNNEGYLIMMIEKSLLSVRASWLSAQGK